MVADLLQSDEINVLASQAGSTPDNGFRGQASSPQAGWDWPRAVREILRPRGVNLLVADSPNDIVNVLRHRRIRTAIVDTGREQGGLWTLKIIRLECPSIPCILLASNATRSILDEALRLDVFSVIDKPVDMKILKDLLNRLFVKRYGSHIFSV